MKVQEDRARLLTVLVVDPDQAECDVLCRAVGEAYPVLVAWDYNDALRLAYAAKPDLIVAGVASLLAVDVERWIRRLRDNPSTRRVPVVMLARGDMPGGDDMADNAFGGGHLTTTVLAANPVDGWRVREELYRITGVPTPRRSTLPRGWRHPLRPTEREPRSWMDVVGGPDLAVSAVFTHAPI